MLLDVGSRKARDRLLIPFITTFLTQHYLIKKIIRKHWHLLGNDMIVKTFLPVNPQVIFRGVPSLQDRVAPNVVDPPSKKVSFFRNFQVIISAGGVKSVHWIWAKVRKQSLSFQLGHLKNIQSSLLLLVAQCVLYICYNAHVGTSM